MDKPVLFCCNHPNAFMDAIMVGSAIPRRGWFLARSDAFRNKTLAKFYGFIGIIPIYRLLEGADGLQKNDETFGRCTELLEENKAVVIYSEGLCIQERRLRKIRKGSARIAFGSEKKNNFNLGLIVIPVGINYSATPWKFRSSLYVEFGEPMPMSDYKELFLQDKARAMNLFTQELEARMKKLLVNIDDKENDKLVNTLEEMLLSDWCKDAGLDFRNQKESHIISKKIAETINALAINDPEQLRLLSEQVKNYSATLRKHNLRDWLLRPEQISSMGFASVMQDFAFFFFLFPFWVFGTITNYLPYKIPYLIAQKTVKSIEWHASVNGTISVFLWQLFFVLESLAVALCFRNWYVLVAFVIAMPVCGVIAQEYWRRMRKSTGKSNLIRVFKSHKEKTQNLIELRAKIVAEMNALKTVH